MNTHQRHQELVAANEDAAAFYRRQLLESHGVGPRRYLADRGFAELLDDTTWTIGYAPAGWTTLHHHLANLGYSDDTLLDAGLITITRRGTVIDRFRDRITFGIRDASGRLLGFTARRGPSAPAACPKYLNTATTPIYTKSEQLFGLGEAMARAPQATLCLLTEGPLDAIAIAHGADEDEHFRPLALCGTALTAAHARVLTRNFNGTFVLAFDPDIAGHRALVEASAVLADSTSDIRALPSSTPGDPADVYRTAGKVGIRGLLGATVPVTQAIVDNCIDTWPTPGQGAEADLCCLRHAAQAVMAARPVDVAGAAARIAQRIPFEFRTITRELVSAVHRQA